MAVYPTLTDTGGVNNSSVDDHRDAELMCRIRSGDMAAFETLYVDFYPRLSRFMHTLVRNPETIEELINDTMMVVWEKPDSFGFECKVSTWIFGIAYKKALKASSKSMKSAPHLCVDDLEDMLPDRRASATGQIDLENLLAVALDTVSPDQRAVIELTYYHGLHYQEIAAILGCPENTVKTRMFHARKRLQPFLNLLVPEADDYPYEELP